MKLFRKFMLFFFGDDLSHKEDLAQLSMKLLGKIRRNAGNHIYIGLFADRLFTNDDFG